MLLYIFKVTQKLSRLVFFTNTKIEEISINQLFSACLLRCKMEPLIFLSDPMPVDEITRTLRKK